jgi:hypothetical protein
MEPIKEIVAKPRTMQDIRDDRDAIYKKRSENSISLVDDILFQESWPDCIETLKTVYASYYYEEEDAPDDDYDDYNGENDKFFKQCIIFKEKGYSFLGLATIARKEIIPSNKPFYSRYFLLEENIRLCDILNKKNENSTLVSFAEAKEHIKQLLALDFGPTEKDHYFMLLKKYEKFGPLIIQKTLILQNFLLLSKIEIPQEVIKDTTLLMWELEESLF